MASSPPPEHKVIITGTGRTGTTFLVRLLTELGLDTGITQKNWEKKFYPEANAGLEFDLLDPVTPYIVKNPALCETLPAALATGRFIIDHAYIPIRELGDAAASRIRNGGQHGSAPGGLWKTDDPSQQRAVLAEDFHRLVHVLVEREIPFTFLHFPRLVEDPVYAYRQLAYLVQGVPWDAFHAAFARIADRRMVHDYSSGAPPPPAPPPRRVSRSRAIKNALRGFFRGRSRDGAKA